MVFQMFDLDGNGAIELAEFQHIMGQLQRQIKRVSGYQRTGLHPGEECAS